MQGADVLDDGLGDDAVGLVISACWYAAAAGSSRLMALRMARGDTVGVEDDPAPGVSGGAADGLDERLVSTAEEALLVGVEDGHQGDLRQVQPLPQQVDADEHVKLRPAAGRG